MITAEGDGVIEYVDATTIRILYDRTEEEEFVSFEACFEGVSHSEVPPHQPEHDY